jgi:hypothetical protein
MVLCCVGQFITLCGCTNGFLGMASTSNSRETIDSSSWPRPIMNKTAAMLRTWCKQEATANFNHQNEGHSKRETAIQAHEPDATKTPGQ